MWIFIVFGLMAIACALVGAVIFTVLDYKHEGIDSDYYDYKIKHSTF